MAVQVTLFELHHLVTTATPFLLVSAAKLIGRKGSKNKPFWKFCRVKDAMVRIKKGKAA
jgi:hypothetical protein